MNVMGSYHYALVALSILIAMVAAYAALDLAARVTAASGWTRAIWLLGGASAMGIGIWSMHYIGMLAFVLPIPVAYHWPTVLLSLLAAILASVIALHVVSRQNMSGSRALAGSVLMGTGIAGMHYIGMDAMRLPAVTQFNSFLVVLSVVLAVLISLCALSIVFQFRHERKGLGWEKLAGAVVMGAAIPVMHYTGMAAASVTPIVLGLALLTSWVDRRFAEQKLQRSEAYLEEAQRLSHTGSFGWMPSTGEIIWSDETFRIFQYDRTTIPTAELILQRIHPEDAARVKQITERASQDGKDFDYEFRLAMADRSIKHVQLVAHVVRAGSGGGGIEFVGALTDITERKQAEEALSLAQADLAHVSRVTTMGELTASLAHEVNQPITAAITDANACLRWLTRESPDLEEARAAAARIVKDAMRAADIVSRIRLLFKKTTPPREWVDLNDVIREIVVLLRGEATLYAISIRTELALDPPLVMGDRVQLQQVMMNLMMNGTDAMKDVDGTRELAITSQPGKEDCLVSVSDTGVGLPARQTDQIFNAFFTTKPHGTGMGLTISRSIVESHGGRLWAGSNAPRGASFYFTLPSKAPA